jgi:hypothetical protein
VPNLTIAILIAVAVVYDGLIAFMVWFTFAFFGPMDVREEPIGALVFALVALSVVPVTGYCLLKIRAVRRGENPRI